jgi:hypothetical protein
MRPAGRSVAAGLALTLVVGVLSIAGPAVNASPAGAPRAHDFDDVGDSNPFHADIEWLVAEGHATGYADGLYHPTANVSRQAVLQMLWRMSDEPGGPFPAVPFSDVADGHPFATAIGWAYSMGIIGGYADGTFRPGAPVSRQALAAILHKLSGVERDLGGAWYDDVTPDHPFWDHLSWWSATGQARGYPDNTFRPAALVTRQAVARFLFHFDEVMGGFWPYQDHHDHVCTEEPTDQEEEAAADLLAAVEEDIPDLFATRSAAIAKGYISIAPPFAGEGEHLLNVAYANDGIALDPTKPEALVLDSNGVDVAAAMFVREYVGHPDNWPPEPGGCLTLWHGHINLCWSKPMLEGGFVVGFTSCWSSLAYVTPEMLHVWRDAFWDGGPFDPIDT